jgi:CheY-like chemotaxis protein
MRAMLVEDSLTQAEFYKSILLNMGIEVHLEHNGQSALNYAFRYHPDFIVLDVNLPLMNGVQVSARLSRAPFTQDIPIILLTERSFESLAGLESITYIAKDHNASYHLTKVVEELLQY